jgi:hypothetical protein
MISAIFTISSLSSHKSQMLTFSTPWFLIFETRSMFKSVFRYWTLFCLSNNAHDSNILGDYLQKLQILFMQDVIFCRTLSWIRSASAWCFGCYLRLTFDLMILLMAKYWWRVIGSIAPYSLGFAAWNAGNVTLSFGIHSLSMSLSILSALLPLSRFSRDLFRKRKFTLAFKPGL